jgi:intracellular multiplication protein IcmK
MTGFRTRHEGIKYTEFALIVMAYALVFLFALPGPAVADDEETGDTPGQSQDGFSLQNLERNKLYDESLEQLLPLKPGHIRDFTRRRDEVERSIEPGPAMMRTQTRQIAVTPAAAPQVIMLTAGYSSTLVFQDSTGAPWPVLSTVLGSAGAFEVIQARVELEVITERQGGAESAAQARAQAQAGGQPSNVTSNVINIVPRTNHASSNLVVTLENAPFPLILHLLTESQAKEHRISDALIVFRLDRHGPYAAMPQIEPASAAETAVTAEMLGFVHGIAPQGAVAVKVTPSIPGLSVWEYRNRLYLRTAHAAVWPAWTAAANGDDVRVYLMPKTPSIVVSVNGVQQKLTLENR